MGDGSSAHERRIERRVIRHLVVGALVLGGSIRLATASFYSYWPDELATLRWSSEPLRALMTTFGQGATSHLYDLFMRLWIPVFGASPLAIKTPSLIAGIVTIPLVYLIGRRWLGDSSAALAALLVALSRPLILYSRMARPYALLIVLTLLSMALLVRYLCVHRRRDLIYLALLNAVLVTLSLNAVYVLIVQAAAVGIEALIKPQPNRRQLIGLGSAFLATGLLVAVFYSGMLESLRAVSSSDKAEFIRADLLWDTFAYNHPSARLLLLGAMALGTLTALRRSGLAGRLLVLWALVPPFFYVLSRISYPVSGVARYLTPTLPAQLLLVALGLVTAVRFLGRRSRWSLPMAVIVAFTMCLWNRALWAPNSRLSIFREQLPTATALARIREVLRPGDVLTTDLESRFHWMFAAQRDLHAVPPQRLAQLPSLEHPGRLLILTYDRPDAVRWWSKHFDVEVIGDARFRERLFLLVSEVRPGGSHMLRRPLRAFLRGYVIAARRLDREDWWRASRQYLVLARVHGLLRDLATTSEAANRQRELAREYALRSGEAMRRAGRASR